MLAVIVAVSLMPSKANAAVYYWTGNGGNTDWNNVNNWYIWPFLGVFTGYPGAGDDAYIGSFTPILGTDVFTGPYSPTVNVATTCQRVYVGQNKAATLTVSSALTLTGAFLATDALTVYSGGTVNATANITISAGSNVFANAGVVNISGATLALSGSSSSLQNTSTGVITINGTSTVTFAGSAVITNSGTFNAGTSGSRCTLNLSSASNSVTNNSGGFFNLGSTSIINLTGNSARVTNSSGGRFTLQSDALGSAAIGNISGSSAGLTGYFDVQRFFTGGGLTSNRGYRLLSSPVNQSNSTTSTSTFGLSYLKNHTYLNITYTGVFTGGTGGTGSGFSGTSLGPSIYLYKESLAASNTSYISGKHVGIASIAVTGSPTSTTTGTLSTVNTVHATDAAVTGLNIPIGNGYLFYFVGPSTRTTGSATGAPPVDAITTANGYINQGNFVVHLWFNGTGVNTLSYAAPGPGIKGYNMLGNPYPCTIDLATVITDNPGVDNFYLLNQRAGGTNQNYVAYSKTGGNSSPLAQQYVVSGGGFLVHAINGSQTFTFKESQKVPTINPTGTGLIMSAPKAEILAVNGQLTNAQQRTMAMPAQNNTALTGLYMKMEKDSLNFDYCGIYFGTNYDAKFEDGDARYINGPNNVVTMASQSADGISSAINNMPDYHAGGRIKLNVNAAATGLYKLKLEGVRNIDTLYDIYLMDRYMNDSLDIRRHRVYNFNLNKADSATFGANRFELSIRRRPLPQYLLTDFYAAKVTGGINITWKTQNESNYTGFTLEKQTRGSNEYTSLFDEQSDGRGAYNTIDRQPTSGNNVYRLKQNNADGRISYSQPITIFYDSQAGNGLINVFPNPTAQMINVSIPATTAAQQNYRMRVYNSTGYMVMQKNTPNNNWTENIADFRPGVYVVEVIKADGSTLGKVKFIKN
ncbi:T9SS type A sorting domain-containing protein [Mucilaginibacter pedocola]|nr:T9SS type A sorting domain-containing protein [Mucilaginibacter pedocola]